MGRRQQVVDVSYTQMLDDLESKDVKEIKYDNSSLDVRYTKEGEEGTVYTTTAMSGAQDSLEQAIRESGAAQTNIVQQDNSLWTYMLLMYGLPILIFFLLGVWLNRRMKKAAGDDNPSMNFGGGFGGMGGGLGKSGARIVASKDVGVTFRGRCRQGRGQGGRSRRSSTSWRTPSATRTSAHACRAVPCWWALRVPVRRCLLRQLLARPAYRSLASRALSL